MYVARKRVAKSDIGRQAAWAGKNIVLSIQTGYASKSAAMGIPIPNGSENGGAGGEKLIPKKPVRHAAAIANDMAMNIAKNTEKNNAYGVRLIPIGRARSSASRYQKTPRNTGSRPVANTCAVATNDSNTTALIRNSSARRVLAAAQNTQKH